MTGYNATVLAYGATGSGKTYTMLGSSTSPGIMLLTLKELYERVGAADAAAASASSAAAGGSPSRGVRPSSGPPAAKVTLSYVEIYNENIRDLLTEEDEHLDLREDPVRGPQVAGVSEFDVASPGAVMELLARGNRRRTQEATAANKESSRSHAVLQIVVEQKVRHAAPRCDPVLLASRERRQRRPRPPSHPLALVDEPPRTRRRPAGRTCASAS